MRLRLVTALAAGFAAAAAFAQGAEVDRHGKVVWEHTVNGEIYSAQRLANGNTVINENTQHRITEVDPLGRIVHEVPIVPKSHPHNGPRSRRPATSAASGSDRAAGARPPAPDSTASSTSRPAIFSTAWPTSCHRRGRPTPSSPG